MRWCVVGRLAIDRFLAGSKLAPGAPRRAGGVSLPVRRDRQADACRSPKRPGPGLVPAIVFALLTGFLQPSSVEAADRALVVLPDRVELEGNFARAQLL